jgi:hypothetical protein
VDTLSVPSAFVAVCAAFSFLAVAGGRRSRYRVLGHAPSFTLTTLVFLAQRFRFKFVPVTTDIRKSV